MKSTILIVDDVPMNIQLIAGHLGEEDYELIMATNGEAALKSIENDSPDLILLDINMPGIDGFEVCKRLKSSTITKDIPIIFLTARADIEGVINGFDVGAVDYITKPFNKSELKARVKTHLELYLLRKELELKNKLLEIASLTDPLTKLENRRSILQFLETEDARINRGGKTAVIILSDIDNFKSINDELGHDCGDKVLIDVSHILSEEIRKNDRVSRWGGEEFLIVLPETDLETGRGVAEKVRKAIASHQLKYDNKEVPVTLTLGISAFIGNGEIDNSIKKADSALYIGKEQGKNRVI